MDRDLHAERVTAPTQRLRQGIRLIHAARRELGGETSSDAEHNRPHLRLIETVVQTPGRRASETKRT